MRFKALLIATFLLGTLAIASPVAACNPNRASSATNLFVEYRLTAQSGVQLKSIAATIEEDAVFTEPGGYVNQYLQLRDSGGHYIRAGINSTNGKAVRLFIQGGEPSGGIGTLYYTYNAANDRAQITLINLGNGDWQVRSGPTVLTTIYYDDTWTATIGSKYVTSNNRGNQIPGHAGNAAYFLGSTYTSQYGTASWTGTPILPTPWPAGASFGSDSSGVWTRDQC